MSAMPDVQKDRLATQEREGSRTYRVPCDHDTQRAIFDLMKRPSHVGEVAQKVWGALQQERERALEEGVDLGAEFVVPGEVAKTIKPEVWKALEYELEDDRICRGEITPRVKEFMDSRELLAESVRGVSERVYWENIKTTNELMSDKEKETSVLFRELNDVLQKVVGQLGFKRPVQLEITRSPDFNAFILNVAREGGIEKTSNVPLRVFVHSGFIDKAKEFLAKQGKVFAPDHLAFILGHELAHLKQPGYNPDQPPSDAEENQRHEYDADTIGLEGADRAGYNPRAGIELMEVVQQHGENWKELLGHYFQRTHPVTENRVKELWQIYERSDQPFFSAAKKFDTFSPEVFQEVDKLLRKDFLRQTAEARSMKDLEGVVERLEKDPDMTLKDVEVAGTCLRQHVDMRMGLAAALHDLEGGGPLSEVVLARANRALSMQDDYERRLAQDPALENTNQKYAPWSDLLPTGRKAVSASIPLFSESVFDVVLKEPGSELGKEFSPEQVPPKSAECVRDFFLEHDVLIDPKGAYFTSINELFDEANPHAIRFWDSYTKYGHEMARGLSKIKSDERYRALVLEWMAGKYVFGVSQRHEYSGEELQKRLAFIDRLHAQDSSATPGAVGAWNLDGLKRMVEGRVAGYKAPIAESPATISASERKAPPKRQEFVLHERLRAYLPLVPPEAYQLGAKPPLEASPLQSLTWRYLQAAHRIFEREMDSGHVGEQFKIEVEPNPAAKQLLFEGIFSGLVCDGTRTHEKIRSMKIEDVRAMPQVFDYLRCLSVKKVPTYLEEDVEGQSRQAPFSLIVRGLLGDHGTLTDETAIGERLQRVRVASLHPTLMMHQWGTPNIQDKELASVVTEANNLFDLKRSIFRHYLELGWRSPTPNGKEPSKRTLLERRKEALENRARAEGLPGDFFWMRELELGTGKQLLRHVGFTSKQEEEAQKRLLDRIFSEEFMRLQADGMQEMERCDANSIKLTYAF